MKQPYALLLKFYSAAALQAGLYAATPRACGVFAAIPDG